MFFGNLVTQLSSNYKNDNDRLKNKAKYWCLYNILLLIGMFYELFFIPFSEEFNLIKEFSKIIIMIICVISIILLFKKKIEHTMDLGLVHEILIAIWLIQEEYYRGSTNTAEIYFCSLVILALGLITSQILFKSYQRIINFVSTNILNIICYFSYISFAGDYFIDTWKYLLYSQIVILSSCFYVFYLNINERKILEQEREVKKMSQLIDQYIPICASCKSVKDESGNWVSIEEFLTSKKNEHIKLSHGYCDKCTKKFCENIDKNFKK